MALVKPEGVTKLPGPSEEKKLYDDATKPLMQLKVLKDNHDAGITNNLDDRINKDAVEALFRLQKSLNEDWDNIKL